MRMQDYVVIDLEMTGLNAKTDHILEVGAVRVRNHQAVDKFGAILCQNVKICLLYTSDAADEL